MPHTIQIRGKKVSVTDGSVVVLKIYETTIGSLEEAQKIVLGFSLEAKPRPGFMSSVVKATAEKVTQSKQGATEYNLNPIECSLNEFAYRLREQYLIGLNRLIEASGKTPEQAEQEVIESRYILVRELIVRLVTVALSEEENRKRSGIPLILAFEQFVKGISQEDDKLNLSIQFRYGLNQVLAGWVTDFKSAVETLESNPCT